MGMEGDWLERVKDLLKIEQGREEGIFIKRSGMRAENQVENALRFLKKRKEISGYKKSEKNSPEDRAGIDFEVRTPDGRKIYLQVKARVPRKMVRVKRLMRVYPGVWINTKGIFFIEVKAGESFKRTVSKIREILKFA
jgi:hypothetical protein